MQSLNDYIFSFFIFFNWNFEIFWACNTPLERYLQDLSNRILQASKFHTF